MAKRSDIDKALHTLAPAIPAYEADVVLDAAMDSPGLRQATPEEAAWLALTAYIRHEMTDYDALLDDGYDRESARFFVVERMNEVLAGWRARRKVSGDAG